MNKVELNGKWNLVGLSPEGEKVELFADVPGSALSAILNSDIENKLNVFYRDNADKVQNMRDTVGFTAKYLKFIISTIKWNWYLKTPILIVTFM